MTTTGNFVNRLTISHTKDHPQDTANHDPKLEFAQSLTDGTGENKVDNYFGGTFTADGAAATHDITALINIYGGTLSNATKLKALIVHNDGTVSSQTLTVGADPRHVLIVGGTAETFDVGAGGVAAFYHPFGYTVTDGTNDIIKVDPSGGTIDYELGILTSQA